MIKLTVNSKTYNSSLAPRSLDLNNQKENKKIGRVVVDYNLPHDNTSVIKFYLTTDDGKQLMYRMFISGKGSKHVPSLLFDKIEVDEHFGDTKVYLFVNDLV